MLLIGDDYQKLKQYDLAIASYKRAGEMIRADIYLYIIVWNYTLKRAIWRKRTR